MEIVLIRGFFSSQCTALDSPLQILVNPFSTREGKLGPPNYYSSHQIFRPADRPENRTGRCGSVKKGGLKMLLYQNHNELTVLLLSDWCLKRHSSTISKIPILEPKILQGTLFSENSA